MPSLDHPPIQAHRFSIEAYKSGIEEHPIDGVPVEVYSPEKTINPAFREQFIKFYKKHHVMKMLFFM
jgi:hypothetical protein